jgi:hypothetical protein
MTTTEKINNEPRHRLHWHWQNLNDNKDGSQGSGLIAGRCWWHLLNGTLGLEWSLGKPRFHIGFDIDDYDLTIAFSIPLLSLYLSIESMKWCRWIQPMEMSKYTNPPMLLPKARECRIAIHDVTLWINPWSKTNEWTKSDPWWQRGISWNFNPFDWRHMRHSVRTAVGSWEPYVGSWERDKAADHRETFQFPYCYVLRSGEVQERIATVYVDQMEWRPRCLKWTKLFAKIRTSIDVQFNDEVGERTGSWKGGTIGCNYELRPNETPEQCLRRMESERKF